MSDAYFLSNSDRQVLKWMIQKARQELVNSANLPGNQLVAHQEHQAPEVYIARVEEDGLTAAVEDSGADFQPGEGRCSIYRVTKVDGTKYLHKLPGEPRTIVHNLSTEEIPIGSWLLVQRDKFGSWVVPIGPAGPAGETGTLEVYLAKQQIVSSAIKSIRQTWDEEEETIAEYDPETEWSDTYTRFPDPHEAYYHTIPVDAHVLMFEIPDQPGQFWIIPAQYAAEGQPGFVSNFGQSFSGPKIFLDNTSVVGTMNIDKFTGVNSGKFSGFAFTVGDKFTNGMSAPNDSAFQVWSDTAYVDTSDRIIRIYGGVVGSENPGIVDINGVVRFGHLADSNAPNDSTYYSTDATFLVYKDSSGTVHSLGGGIPNGTSTGDLISWNGSAWVVYSPGTDHGFFTWNGSSWGITKGTTNGDLLRWNGTDWVTLSLSGTGLVAFDGSGSYTVITGSTGDLLYNNGSGWTTISPGGTAGLWRWDGSTTWSVQTFGSAGIITTDGSGSFSNLSGSTGDLLYYSGSNWSTVSPGGSSGFWKWDGSSTWSVQSFGFAGLLSTDGTGTYSSFAGSSTGDIPVWGGSSWSAFSPGGSEGILYHNGSGTWSSIAGTNGVQVTSGNIQLVNQGSVSALTDSTGGSGGTTINDVSGSFDQAILNNNFASLVAAFNDLRSKIASSTMIS